MTLEDIVLSEKKFIANFVQNSAQIMWFLGAGISRSAGMPTATDLIRDLKFRYYCLHENQNISNHDISNKAIQSRVQAFFDSKGCPPIWSSDEYSYYFSLNFEDDYEAQQKYIFEKLSPEKISTNIGHRALAAFMGDGVTKAVFTTNFDEVIETAFSEVMSSNLTAFHLEASYASLDALNSERFPLYAKLHGDFRYTKLKNLKEDLIDNDVQIQKCFVSAGTRYGVVVSGYSGRDANVMGMFNEVLAQNNAFPHGLYWTVPNVSDVTGQVVELINEARRNDVSAYLVPTGTFDVMMSKLWKQTPHADNSLDAKVRTATARPVNIDLPAKGSLYPIVRTNALPVIEVPRRYGIVNCTESMTFRDLNDAMKIHKPDAILIYKDKVLFWGNESEVRNTIDHKNIIDFNYEEVPETAAAIAESGFLKSFYEQAIAKALCAEKPLHIRKRKRTSYIVVDYNNSNDSIFSPLADALAFRDRPASLAGMITKGVEYRWAEAISLKLQESNNRLWLMLRPEIWITPLSEREHASQFIRQKKLYRYNKQSSAVLDAWIGILLNTFGQGANARVSCFAGTDFPAEFVIGSRTAYSRRVDV